MPAYKSRLVWVVVLFLMGWKSVVCFSSHSPSEVKRSKVKPKHKANANYFWYSTENLPFIILPVNWCSLFTFGCLVFRPDDSSPPVPRPRSSSSRSADDVLNDAHVTNGSNRLSADLDNYAQVGLVISVSLLLLSQQWARLLCSIL